MGNPHAVQVVADVERAPVTTQGPLLEHHARFPNRVNAGYLQVRAGGIASPCGSGNAARARRSHAAPAPARRWWLASCAGCSILRSRSKRMAAHYRVLGGRRQCGLDEGPARIACSTEPSNSRRLKKWKQKTSRSSSRQIRSFFDQHPQLLETIYVPHPHGGRAIPLTERQIVSLRDKVRMLEGKLGEFVRFGEDNDAIGEKVHRLSLR